MATKAKAKAPAAPCAPAAPTPATNGHTITLTDKGKVFVPRSNNNVAKWAMVCHAVNKGLTTTQLMAHLKTNPQACAANGTTYVFDFAYFGYAQKNQWLTLTAVKATPAA